MIYVFDLDETICTTKGINAPRHEKYKNAKPIEKTVNLIIKLYNSGNIIIINTARGMVTNNDDVDAVIEDVGEITKNWLIDNGVPFHQLCFGKPYGDVYIDDKALNVENLDDLKV